MKRMGNRGVLAALEAYDLEREAYIRTLEKENDELRRERSEQLDLLMAGEAARSSLMLKAIVAGAFDNVRKIPPPPDATEPEETEAKKEAV